MSEQYKANTDYPYFVTFTLNGWVDLFTRSSYCQILLDSLLHCHVSKGLVIHEFVIMSNHAHFIFQHDDARLAAILRDFKSFTAMEIIKALKTDEQESRREWILRLFKYYAKYQKQNTQYSVWKKTSKPIELPDVDRYTRCKEYIHQNPVKAGWVADPAHWLNSSACPTNSLATTLGKRS